MKTSALIFATLLATSTMYAADINSYEVALTNDKVNYIDVPSLNLQLKTQADINSYEVALTNDKVNYIDVPSLNLQLKTQEESSYEFIINYATSLFSKTKEQDSVQKQHSLHLSLNYEF